MSRINDETTELVGGARAVRVATREAVARPTGTGGERLRSSAKTRKSALTRERIMTAASELMTERGTTGFQMSEVSDRCQMSKGALYYYFADKDELIAAIFDVLVDDLVDGIESLVASAPSAREALRALYGEFTRRLRAGSPLAMAMTHQLAGSTDTVMPGVTTHFSRAARIIAEQIERAKAEGAVREEVDSTIAAVFATGGLIATSMAVASGQTEEGPDVVSQGLTSLILHGVGTDDATLAQAEDATLAQTEDATLAQAEDETLA